MKTPLSRLFLLSLLLPLVVSLIRVWKSAMAFDSRMEGGMQILPPQVHKTIQLIKEIVGNHSDADIYVALREMNMDPNETVQKLLNQGFSFSCFGQLFFVLLWCYLVCDKWVYLNWFWLCIWLIGVVWWMGFDWIVGIVCEEVWNWWSGMYWSLSNLGVWWMGFRLCVCGIDIWVLLNVMWQRVVGFVAVAEFLQFEVLGWKMILWLSFFFF